MTQSSGKNEKIGIERRARFAFLNYHIYNTSGLIIAGVPSGEASRYVYIFTKDLGLVGAHAQNTRNISSKLRYALDAPARSRVSLVRGKNSWRLVSAVPDKRFCAVFAENSEKIRLCARTFSLIKKLLAGEEANERLFSVVSDFLDFLETMETDGVGKDGKDGKDENVKNVEAVLLLRILHLLGYLPENKLTREFARGAVWNEEIVRAMSPYRKEAVKIINESLRASDL